MAVGRLVLVIVVCTVMTVIQCTVIKDCNPPPAHWCAVIHTAHRLHGTITEIAQASFNNGEQCRSAVCCTELAGESGLKKVPPNGFEHCQAGQLVTMAHSGECGLRATRREIIRHELHKQ